METVDVPQCTKCACADIGNLTFRQSKVVKLFEDLSETATIHVFHNNPELIRLEVTVEIFDDVGVPTLFHDGDLSGEQFGVLLVQGHLLDGDLAVCDSVVCEENLAGGTLPDLLDVGEEDVRVTGLHKVLDAEFLLTGKRLFPAALGSGSGGILSPLGFVTV